MKDALLADVSMSDILIAQDQKSAINIVDGSAQTAVSIEGFIPNTYDGSVVTTTREPFGPVLSMAAFNFPLTLALRSIVYPLACGNTVILRTSNDVPQLYSLLPTLFADAGLPPGVLQVISFSEVDMAARVEQLISHTNIRHVNFTGSTALGRRLAALCGHHLKPSVMELGGKSAAIVLPSADLSLAANNILFGALFNSGQVCMSTERVLVHASVLPDLEVHLMEGLAQVAGKSFELVREGAPERVRAMIQDAESRGARCLGATTGPASSTSLTPSIVRSPPSSSLIWSEETFSPTLTLTPYASPAELATNLHSIPTGLSTSIFGAEAEALRLAGEIQSGAVHVNGMTIHDQHSLPFGGVRDSGWGRFNGRGAIESFTWLKNTRVVRAPALLPLQAL